MLSVTQRGGLTAFSSQFMQVATAATETQPGSFRTFMETFYRNVWWGNVCVYCHFVNLFCYWLSQLSQLVFSHTNNEGLLFVIQEHVYQWLPAAAAFVSHSADRVRHKVLVLTGKAIVLEVIWISFKVTDYILLLFHSVECFFFSLICSDTKHWPNHSNSRDEPVVCLQMNGNLAKNL